FLPFLSSPATAPYKPVFLPPLSFPRSRGGLRLFLHPGTIPCPRHLFFRETSTCCPDMSLPVPLKKHRKFLQSDHRGSFSFSNRVGLMATFLYLPSEIIT